MREVYSPLPPAPIGSFGGPQPLDGPIGKIFDLVPAPTPILEFMKEWEAKLGDISAVPRLLIDNRDCDLKMSVDFTNNTYTKGEVT